MSATIAENTDKGRKNEKSEKKGCKLEQRTERTALIVMMGAFVTVMVAPGSNHPGHVVAAAMGRLREGSGNIYPGQTLDLGARGFIV